MFAKVVLIAVFCRLCETFQYGKGSNNYGYSSLLSDGRHDENQRQKAQLESSYRGSFSHSNSFSKPQYGDSSYDKGWKNDNWDSQGMPPTSVVWDSPVPQNNKWTNGIHNTQRSWLPSAGKKDSWDMYGKKSSVWDSVGKTKKNPWDFGGGSNSVGSYDTPWKSYGREDKSFSRKQAPWTPVKTIAWNSFDPKKHSWDGFEDSYGKYSDYSFSKTSKEKDCQKRKESDESTSSFLPLDDGYMGGTGFQGENNNSPDEDSKTKYKEYKDTGAQKLSRPPPPFSYSANSENEQLHGNWKQYLKPSVPQYNRLSLSPHLGYERQQSRRNEYAPRNWDLAPLIERERTLFPLRYRRIYQRGQAAYPVNNWRYNSPMGRNYYVDRSNRYNDFRQQYRGGYQYNPGYETNGPSNARYDDYEWYSGQPRSGADKYEGYIHGYKQNGRTLSDYRGYNAIISSFKPFFRAAPFHNNRYNDNNQAYNDPRRGYPEVSRNGLNRYGAGHRYMDTEPFEHKYIEQQY